jgi:hypothetical protein
MLQRCNTTFGDTGNSAYKHWIFCRAFRLPSGDTYSNLTELDNSPDSATPENLVTLNFFHAGNIDDKSEDWLIPFMKRYRSNCMQRPVNVIWMGAYVTKNGNRRITDGNKWHVTSKKWGDSNTVLYDLSTESSQVYSGHSTASCPFDSAASPDTRGIYVGGTAEQRARRVTARFDTGLYVGTGSDSQDQCYSGVTNGNPVTASGGGVQFEYNVALGNPDEDLTPYTIASTVIPEVAMNYKTDTPPVSTSLITNGGKITVSADVDTGCISDSTSFYLASTDTKFPRVKNYSDSRSASLIEEGFDTSLVHVEIETEKPVDTSCVSISMDLNNLKNTAIYDTFTPIIYQETSETWQKISELNQDYVYSDTPPVLEFQPPHFSSFGVAVAWAPSGEESTTVPRLSSSGGSSCILDRMHLPGFALRNLREFRDTLLESKLGRLVTSVYYFNFHVETPDG